ncbi:MAG: Gfo/Idh/MocA family oxidoreductase [Lentisphaeria bacterium]|nr:Gfo/Idh/MocA family oxidoreductase [Lentisphaerota bacterium]
MSRKVKYGIIGTGAIAKMHADALASLEKAELFMVFDTVLERAQAFAQERGCLYASSLEELLASGIDAVTIATPSGLHGSCAIPAALAGKHILCEKPLEVSVSKVNDMIRTCETHNVRLSAVFQARFSESVRLIKTAVDQGRFGQHVLGSASVRWYRSPEYYANAGWRGTWELDGGGALMNQGIHTVDLLLHFNGDPREVTGRFTRVKHKGIEVEDTVVAMVQFKNGSLGTIEASTACAPGFPRRVELSGTGGSVILEGDEIKRWEFIEELPEDEQIRQFGGKPSKVGGGGAGDPMAISSEGHRRQLYELTEAILGGHHLTAPGSEGKRAVELICAVYESARTGTSIHFL